MAKPRLRNNIGQFQKYATIAMTNEMKQLAEETKVNVQKVIEDKLYETYTNNVRQSYGPRSSSNNKHTYEHTDTFIESISTVIEGDKVSIKIDENKKYNQISERTVGQVYKFLAEGTKGRRILSIL